MLPAQPHLMMRGCGEEKESSPLLGQPEIPVERPNLTLQVDVLYLNSCLPTTQSSSLLHLLKAELNKPQAQWKTQHRDE